MVLILRSALGLAVGIGSAVAVGSSSSCKDGLTCIGSPSQIVNAALSSNLAVGGATMGNSGTSQADRTAMSFTINDCAQALETRLKSFEEFQSANDKIWADVGTVQQTLTGVEGAASGIQKTQSGFATQLGQLATLFEESTARATDLGQWLDGEKVVRTQLTSLYNALDKKVLDNSDQVVVTASAIRDALTKMQTVHDHATQILTAVGDAETEMYEWAFNVTQKVNWHTVSLVAVAQTLEYRNNQVASVKDANVQLNWIVSQLADKYGKDKLMELSQKFDAGTLEFPSGGGQNGVESTSKTAASTTNTIAPA